MVACAHCGKTFTHQSILKAHELNHTNERPFTCTHTDCGYGCKRDVDLGSHKRRNHPTDEKEFLPCPFNHCRCRSLKLNNLSIHINRDHRALALSQPQKNLRKRILGQQEKQHPTPEEDTSVILSQNAYTCLTCGKTFTYTPILEAHQKHNHDPEIKKPYACDFPDCSFASAFPNLDYHKKTHKKGTACPFQGCRFKTGSKMNYAKHINEHHYLEKINQKREYSEEQRLTEETSHKKKNTESNPDIALPPIVTNSEQRNSPYPYVHDDSPNQTISCSYLPKEDTETRAKSQWLA